MRGVDERLGDVSLDARQADVEARLKEIFPVVQAKIVEQSHLPAKRTLDQLGIASRTFYRWYDRYLEGGPEALEDRSSAPSRVWNRIGDDIQHQIVDMALDYSELSPRELALQLTKIMPLSTRRSSTRGLPWLLGKNG